METYTGSDLLANGIPGWMGEDESPNVTAAYFLAGAIISGYGGLEATIEAWDRVTERHPDIPGSDWWETMLSEFVQQDARDEAERRKTNADMAARNRYERRLIQNHRAKLIRRRSRGRLVDPLPVWKQRVEAALFARPGTRRKGSDELSIRCIEPGHDDKHPSAGWNISGGYGHCHACGASWNTKEAAALLGINLQTRSRRAGVAA